MGKTMVIYRVQAADMERIGETIEALKQAEKGDFQDAKREAIGFGVEIIKAGFTVPEKDDKVVEELTKELNALPQVEEAEMQEMTLV